MLMYNHTCILLNVYFNIYFCVNLYECIMWVSQVDPPIRRKRRRIGSNIKLPHSAPAPILLYSNLESAEDAELY